MQVRIFFHVCSNKMTFAVRRDKNRTRRLSVETLSFLRRYLTRIRFTRVSIFNDL